MSCSVKKKFGLVKKKIKKLCKHFPVSPMKFPWYWSSYTSYTTYTSNFCQTIEKHEKQKKKKKKEKKEIA